MLVNKTYKHLLKPTPEQEILFRQYAGCCRLIYNLALTQRKTAYRKKDYKPVSLNAISQSNDLTKLRQYAKTDEEWNFIQKTPAVIQQQVLKDLDSAYAFFFKGTGGFPKYRTRGRKESFRFPSPKDITTHAENYPGQIRLPKVGWVSIRNSWERLDEHKGENKLYEGTIKNATVKHEVNGWHITFNCEVDIPEPNPILPGLPIGIDLGITNSMFISAGQSDNMVIQLPVITSREYYRLGRMQASLSRKVKGSNNYRKQQAKIAIKYAYYARRKKDAIHKITTQLTRDNQHSIIVLEDLKIKNMSKSAKGTLESPGTNVAAKSGLNREILNQSWGLTRQLLKYKSEWNGNYYTEVNPAYSSQQCSKCGHTDKRNRSSQSDFACIECGYQANADENASLNILERGLKQLAGLNLRTDEERAELKRVQSLERIEKRRQKNAARAKQLSERARKREEKNASQVSLKLTSSPTKISSINSSTAGTVESQKGTIRSTQLMACEGIETTQSPDKKPVMSTTKHKQKLSSSVRKSRSHKHDKAKQGTGTEGNVSDDLAIPFAPRKDDKTPLGDTDQHSKVDHNVDKTTPADKA